MLKMMMSLLPIFFDYCYRCLFGSPDKLGGLCI